LHTIAIEVPAVADAAAPLLILHVISGQLGIIYLPRLIFSDLLLICCVSLFKRLVARVKFPSPRRRGQHISEDEHGEAVQVTCSFTDCPHRHVGSEKEGYPCASSVGRRVQEGAACTGREVGNKSGNEKWSHSTTDKLLLPT